MMDRFSRPLTSLRISVTNRCNLGCFYCHREGHISGKDLLSVKNIENIGKASKRLGITKVKLTGGEPLIRDDLEDIVKVLSENMEEVSLTTNGIGLERRADTLKKSGLKRVNISLDTLNEELYKRITGSNKVRDVIKGIKASVHSGLFPVKINMVYLKGLNTSEVWALASFAWDVGAILQVIELEASREKLDDKAFKMYHQNPTSLEKELSKRAVKVIKRDMHARRQYFIPINGDEVAVEIVHPMHNSVFCANCTRLRLTADGFLKPCLLRDDNLVDVKDALDNVDGLVEKIKLANSLREPYWR